MNESNVLIGIPRLHPSMFNDVNIPIANRAVFNNASINGDSVSWNRR